MTDTTAPTQPEMDGPDPVLLKDIADAVDERDTRWLSRTLKRMHPADAADALETLPYDIFEDAVELLGEDLPSEILIELRDAYREGAVEMLTDEAVAQALDELDSDDATTILEDLEDDRRERILEDLAPVDRAELERSLAYEEDSAGRLMQTEFVAVPEFWTVGETIDYTRGRGEDLPETFYEIYVVDPAHRLLGIVQLSALMRQPREVALEDIMEDPMTTLTPDLDQEEVAFRFQKYSLASAPVTDTAGRLVGMITVDDMVDVIQEEHAEDLLALSNVSSADASDTVFDTVRARLPWLGVNLATAFVSASVISVFEATIEEIVALAILMPVVASTAGNAGSQGLAVAVRAIATRQLEGAAARRAVLREILTALFNGLMIGSCVGLIAFIWFRDVHLSGVIAIAMLGTFLWSGLVGTLVPLTLKRLGADPAVASSVFVLTTTDVIAFFTFLGLASIVLL
ncbi:MAG: magnesium transporter [Alphaproteobacteria bacterium HGW-Alphaproteobacteria-18]|nr:MAG: magnesium transporter [Alphaproteobacteria bacterium HGW-Alphaproteobacteria-18]